MVTHDRNGSPINMISGILLTVECLLSKYGFVSQQQLPMKKKRKTFQDHDKLNSILFISVKSEV